MKQAACMIRLVAAIVLFASALMAAPAGGGPTPAPTFAASPVKICIDPGHQRYGNDALEPVAPGSAERKPKVSSGTAGVSTGKPEYVLNLEVALRLKDKLQARGYEVIMTRESHDVDISNRERAELANRAGADLVVRIHADGEASGRARGLSVLYPAKGSGSSGAIYEPSREAAGIMLEELQQATGAQSRGAVPRSDLTGFNWSSVPAILVEMGFMSNAEEDRLMATAAYQEKLAEGMANGVDRFFSGRASVVPQEESFSGDLTLLEEAALYRERGNRSAVAEGALSPQTVTAAAKAGNWYLVETWLGKRWIYAEHALAGAPLPLSATVQLSAVTSFYRYPAEGLAAWGQLSPQLVDAFEEWNGWYHIRTWLGDAWIQGGAAE